MTGSGTPQATIATALAGPPTAGAETDQATRLKRSELLEEIKSDRLVVVTGTGVTFQSVGYPGPGTEVAGWSGLLSDGLERCRRLKLIDDDDAAIVIQQIRNQKPKHFIDAAQTIHDCLAIRKPERQHWMRESVGSLVVKDSRLIKSILALRGLVATLNYDHTIRQVSGRPALHWKQQNEITKLIRERTKDITLHLHGVCDCIDSIVLDRSSYEDISKNEQMQGVLREFARFKTMLFVGCGRTFLDPNFQALLNWAKTALAEAEHRHFVLCRAEEESAIVTELQPHGYLVPLIYGAQHSDLAGFLEALATDAWGAAVAVNPPTLPQEPSGPHAVTNVLKPADIWKLHSRR